MDVIIRPVRVEDAEAIHEMRTRPRCMWGTLQIPSLTVEQVRKQIAEMPDTMHSFVAEVDGRVVGQISLHLRRGRSAHCAEIGMMVHDDYQGRGIGTRLMEAIVDLADRWLGLQRIELEVYPDNEPAVRLYRRFGFVEEGRRRAAAWRDGAFTDTLIMGRLRPGSEAAAQAGE
ncbi:MAG: GNAT family N-acetyltransferase [Clostridia bacterium]|nr:GNAT family N-acetyltransferase [Clostridia bacterium]